MTTWHPHHIAERYGLFAIILLGETIAVLAAGVSEVVGAGDRIGPLIAVGISALVLIFGLWWLYFLQPAGEGLAENREGAFFWGYGHYFMFAALGALGAGLEVVVKFAGGHEAVRPPWPRCRCASRLRSSRCRSLSRTCASCRASSCTSGSSSRRRSSYCCFRSSRTRSGSGRLRPRRAGGCGRGRGDHGRRRAGWWAPRDRDRGRAGCGGCARRVPRAVPARGRGRRLPRRQLARAAARGIGGPHHRVRRRPVGRPTHPRLG